MTGQSSTKVGDSGRIRVVGTSLCPRHPVFQAEKSEISTPNVGRSTHPTPTHWLFFEENKWSAVFKFCPKMAQNCLSPPRGLFFFFGLGRPVSRAGSAAGPWLCVTTRTAGTAPIPAPSFGLFFHSQPHFQHFPTPNFPHLFPPTNLQ